jgi:hypothetical protein
MVVSALVVPPNNTSTSATTPTLYKRTRIDNTEDVHMCRTDEALGVNTNKYTTQQMEQYYQAHLDTLKMCDVVIAESERDTPLFNRLFALYFDPADRALVLRETDLNSTSLSASNNWSFTGVFEVLCDAKGARKGSPEFEEVDLVDDFPPAYDHRLYLHCGPLTVAAVAMKDELRSKDELILCPRFFTRGTFGGGLGREWPSVGHTPKCINIGNRLNHYMYTMATTLLHEYTHFVDILDPVLGERTKDHENGYGFYSSRKLDKALSTMSAESYAVFATELMWSKLCSRDFDPPVPGNLALDYSLQPWGHIVWKDKIVGIAAWPPEFGHSGRQDEFPSVSRVVSGLWVMNICPKNPRVALFPLSCNDLFRGKASIYLIFPAEVVRG